jgi:hypothetical protein
LVVRIFWKRVIGQERALANARAASTDLSRRRVEREEVELFLERRTITPRRSA